MVAEVCILILILILTLNSNLKYVSSEEVCESGADVPQGRDDQDSYCSRILTLTIMIKKYFDADPKLLRIQRER